jgi:hypothetical protein
LCLGTIFLLLPCGSGIVFTNVIHDRYIPFARYNNLVNNPHH